MALYSKNKITILVSFKEKKIIKVGRKKYINLGEPTEANISKMKEDMINDGFKVINEREFPGGYFLYWERSEH